jgi:hypothetical protein
MGVRGNIRPVSVGNWPASDGIAAVEVDGVVYKFCGWNTAFPSPSTTSRVDMSRDGGTTWYQLPDAPFAPRHTFPVVALGKTIYFVGGDPNSGYYQKDFWKADVLPWGLRYTRIAEVSAPLAMGRVGHICFPFEGKIVLVGGQIVDGALEQLLPANYSTKPGSPYYDDAWTYSPGDADFVKILDNCGYAPAAFMQGSPVLNGKMMLVGCGAYSVPTHGLPRVYADRVMAGTLEGFELITEHGGFTPCMYNSVAVCKGNLVTFGGYNGADLNQLHSSPNGENFKPKTRSIIRNRHAATLFNYRDELRLLGGPIAPPDTMVWGLS